jgi:hypothetical protein
MAEVIYPDHDRDAAAVLRRGHRTRVGAIFMTSGFFPGRDLTKG